jgi:DNA (cytosine-5)-methyltransferase 1
MSSEGGQGVAGTVVDLFCGAGGLSHGFEMAGFRVAAAVDNDPISGETYRRQNPRTPLLTEDVESITGSRLARLAGGEIDVVIGGPSCQGFSTHGKRDAGDPRNSLFRHFVRLVGEAQPLWVVMENVKGLLTYDRGRYRDEIVASFARVGYRCGSRVLLAADYGVPQLRERLFFVATRTEGPISFPSATHCPPDQAHLTGLQPYVTVRDAIGDLPGLGSQGESASYASLPRTHFQMYARRAAPAALSLHRAKGVSDLAMSIITQVPQGAGLRSIPPERLPGRFKRMRKISTGALRKDCTTLYHRLRWDRPSYTITCYFTNVSSGPFVHPSENRALTAREAARLQSFPDSYSFFDRNVPRQIGNAVPPLLAHAVASEVARRLERGATLDRAVAMTA